MNATILSCLLATLLLAGCEYESHARRPDGATSLDAGAAPPPPAAGSFLEHEDPAVQATVQAWRERHLIHGDVRSPDTVVCVEELPRLEVVTVDSDEFRRLCERCDPSDTAADCDTLGRANGCAPIDRLDDASEPRPLNVIARSHREGSAAFQHLVIHETIHHLGRCTGEGMDHRHTREHYWCTGGDVCDEGSAAASITTRARVLLADRRSSE